jgi:hypothetical protein
MQSTMPLKEIIDSVAEMVMRKFNNKRAIVFQTLQMYSNRQAGVSEIPL